MYLSRSKATASPKKKPNVGNYDMRDNRQHTLYLQIVLMKQPGPAHNIKCKSATFHGKIRLFRILPLESKYRAWAHGKQPGTQTTEMSTLSEQWIGSFETKANRQWTEVARPLSRRSWGGTRDKPNVCVGRRVGGYFLTSSTKKPCLRFLTRAFVLLWHWDKVRGDKS